MKLTRRQMLALAGGASVTLLTGCPQLSRAGLIPPAAPGPASGAAPDSPEVPHEVHVLNRLSFGPRPGDYERVRGMGVAAYMDEQLHPDRIDDAWCDYQVRRLELLHLPAGELFEYRPYLLERELVQGKLLRALHSRRQLQEVMADFWTDHFNIDLTKGDCPWLKPWDDREVIRKHALGSFPALLRASALSPAMLWYLDGRANQISHADAQPNENYARELLELHTMGVGSGYTQDDVMNAARCLTGWYVRSDEFMFKGRVEFRPEWHDDGEKRILGHTIAPGGGAADLDRVLDIVAHHPATARHLATKLCRYFISDLPPTEAIGRVAAAFTENRGDIRPTLRALFATDAFRKASGAKLKRPFRFLVSALRAADFGGRPGEALTEYLRRMGHAPFQYPTPDGYPHEAGPWQGTLLWRWHFAVALANGSVAGAALDWAALAERLGGRGKLLAHLFGRRPTADEARVILASNLAPAAALAAPGFQRY